MKRSIATSLFLIAGLLFSLPAISAPQLDVFEVKGVKQGDSLNMRAWPSSKSRIIAALPHNAKWIASTRAPIKKEGSSWRKVHWNGESGWVNTNYIKLDPASTTKARERQSHRLTNQGRNSTEKKSSAKTSTAQTQKTSGKQIVMECGGNAPFWNINMNFTGKNLKVNLRDGAPFESPLYFRQWLKNQNKMVVNSGRGRNAVRAILTKTNTCTDGITNIKYPFAVEATVSETKKVSGCCRSVTR